ncbi:4561_t:CDS:1 [Ambispora leptoticha]|uniref:4561_t:CDS:1 n=1 Tax=Ambispora leptoticha TaxID=144679 RepID=A0A9N8W1J8_9GLOM|nr:4561_t:CDS:1 [Ambispora leptoticha]
MKAFRVLSKYIPPVKQKTKKKMRPSKMPKSSLDSSGQSKILLENLSPSKPSKSRRKEKMIPKKIMPVPELLTKQPYIRPIAPPETLYQKEKEAEQKISQVSESVVSMAKKATAKELAEHSFTYNENADRARFKHELKELRLQYIKDNEAKQKAERRQKDRMARREQRMSRRPVISRIDTTPSRYLTFKNDQSSENPTKEEKSSEKPTKEEKKEKLDIEIRNIIKQYTVDPEFERQHQEVRRLRDAGNILSLSSAHEFDMDAYRERKRARALVNYEKREKSLREKRLSQLIKLYHNTTSFIRLENLDEVVDRVFAKDAARKPFMDSSLRDLQVNLREGGGVIDGEQLKERVGRIRDVLEGTVHGGKNFGLYKLRKFINNNPNLFEKDDSKNENQKILHQNVW